MCGTHLGNVIAPVSAPSVQDSPTRVSTPLPTPPETPPPPPPRPPRPALRLIHSSGREFPLPGEGGYIGRGVQTSGTVAEVDLTGIADERIVSRSHAQIYWDWSQHTYMLVDNNSRNGTYLNGTPLSPNVQYCLKHNDSLQLGQNNLVFFTVALT